MEDVKKINLNEIEKDKISDKKYRHIYEIELKKSKSYFITLISNNDCEFNLRLYDDNKKIIKLKDDDNSDDLSIADINKSIDLINKEVNESLSENDYFSEESEEDQSNQEIINESKDILNNMIFDIIESIKPNDLSNKIEITIELDDENLLTEEDIDDFVKKSEINKEININYNNKIYFNPKKTCKYFISVAADYFNQYGDFSLFIKEVEDIKFTSNKEIYLDSKVIFKSKEKFKSKKFFINLNKDYEYKLEGSLDLKFLISLNEQKIISKSNLINFKANYTGKYEIEVMGLKRNTDGHFKISNCNSDNNIRSIKIYDESFNKSSKDFKFNFDLKDDSSVIKAKKIILLDDNNNEFELSIKNSELKITPI